MVMDFYGDQLQAWFPENGPGQGGTVWDPDAYYLLSDPDYGWENETEILVKAFLRAGTNVNYFNGGFTTQFVSGSLNSGRNLITLTLPVSITFALKVTGTPPNNWYGAAGYCKYGIVRQVLAGYAAKAKYINDLNSAIIFPQTIGDQLEVVLAPGVSGTYLVVPMSGIPPLMYVYFQQILLFSLPWYYNGPDPRTQQP